MNRLVRFGFPDFWQKVYGAHRSVFDAIDEDIQLSQEVFGATKPCDNVQVVVCSLVRMTVTGINELLILAGNGAGAGAMKISRGMFESSVMAEYLRRHPQEAHDYLDYGHVLMWKNVQRSIRHWAPEELKKAKALLKEIEDNYRRVKPHFEDKRGRVRNQWNEKSIGEMARGIGREVAYEFQYSLAASIHHGNQEALVRALLDPARKFADPPCMNLVEESLIAGHLYLLQALHTLNDCLGLGFGDRINDAGQHWEELWK